MKLLRKIGPPLALALATALGGVLLMAGALAVLFLVSPLHGTFALQSVLEIVEHLWA